ncbi:MAG: RusA family crossover junction endodeoxyribonuclease [Rhabdochlamydiaceae bacterium]|jgi:Holliday junction resolvase RusA-like endonuclease
MYIYEIQGNPVPHHETRWSKRSGHAYAPDLKLRQFAQWQLKPNAPEAPLTGRFEIEIWCYFPIAKSIKGVKRAQMLNDVIGHTQRPDWDNLAKFYCDVVKGIIIDDDALISDGTCRKRWAERGKVIIKIHPIAQCLKTQGVSCG